MRCGSPSSGRLASPLFYINSIIFLSHSFFFSIFPLSPLDRLERNENRQLPPNTPTNKKKFFFIIKSIVLSMFVLFIFSYTSPSKKIKKKEKYIQFNSTHSAVKIIFFFFLKTFFLHLPKTLWRFYTRKSWKAKKESE